MGAKQYAAHAYRRLLDKNAIRCSMSRKGNCWDNGAVFETRQQARGTIFNFIEAFYNRQRLHSAIGYNSPVMWEQNAAAA